MDSRFLPHNLHLTDLATFNSQDPHLARLKNMAYVYRSSLIKTLPDRIPGVYTLGGGRQVGKSTLLKQWMLHLIINNKVLPQNIAFFSGEIIDDHHALLQLMQTQLEQMPDGLRYIIIDEVTYIKNWDKAVKYAADVGILVNVILFLTGSDLVLIQEARNTFPGRRGQADVVDFHLYPLSFNEFLELKGNRIALLEPLQHALLLAEFNNYLQHGGYLTAINDLALYGKILNATFATYSDWIRGDMQKRGKQEIYLREIINAIIKRYTSQLSCTWTSLAKELSIQHHKTVADYIDLLQLMDALYVQATLQEDKLLPAPKKAKKVMFTDPFIYHALNAWLNPVEKIYEQQVQPLLQDAVLVSKLVETTVITHYRRKYPTYYISAEGEVDLAYIENGKFWPIEIKWTQQLRARDLKQILKYKNAKIYSKLPGVSQMQGVTNEYLPYALGCLSV